MHYVDLMGAPESLRSASYNETQCIITGTTVFIFNFCVINANSSVKK